MSLILLDQIAPRGLRTALSGHDVRTALQMGWDAIANGDLIAEAEMAGFEVFVSADQYLRYQQNLAGRRVALIVLTTNRRDIISQRLRASSRQWRPSSQAASRP